MISIKQFQAELDRELMSILDYWSANAIDWENGGFVGCIDQENRPIRGAEKGAVLNARILWTFASAYNFTRNEKYLEIAGRAYEYLKERFIDNEFGGLYWSLDSLGNPLNTRKQIYAQGFGIYGFSEFYRATRNEESLRLAIELFNCIENYSYDQKSGGYIEALSRNWNYLDDMRLSEKDANFPKSMNTHLHILEPYTNLFRVWPDQLLKARIRSLIRVFLDHIIDLKTNHFNLFFEKDWTVRSAIISYGHDIEGAWLLTEAAEVLGDENLLAEVEQMAIRMTDATLQEGTADDGSIYYEKEISTGHTDTDRHWWPQAEAMVGFLNAWQITGNDNYLEKSMKVWSYIQKNLVDRQLGEWYWKVDKDGKPDLAEDKVGFWKCPYHNTRACMEVMRRIQGLV